MRSARPRRPSPGMHNGRRGRSSVSSFQVLVVVCIGAAVTMMWYHEYHTLSVGQQTPPSPSQGLRGDGDGDGAFPPALPGGEGEGEGEGKGAGTSSRAVDFVNVGGRIGSNTNTPPVGDEARDSGSSDGSGGSTGGGGGDGGGGKGGAFDSRGERLQPSSDKGAGGGDADAAVHGGQDGTSSEKTHDQNGGAPAVVVGQQPGQVANNVEQDKGGGAGGAGAAPGIGGGNRSGRGGGAGEGGGLGGAVLDDLDPDTLMREQRRERLNGEVEAAVVRQSGHACNVAFVKTHKTASTTLAGVLYRYGLRHQRRVARFKVEGTAVTLEHAAKETIESGNRVEIFHYHYMWNGYFQSTWNQAKALFEDIMVAPTAGADPFHGGTKFVTVLRAPLEHWLSYFYFYYEPEMNVGVEDYFKLGKHKSRPLNNPLAAEFGIYNERDLDEFVLNHLPNFALTMLTEEVDEGLVLLGKVMDWDPIDLTYASLLEARDGATRWDGKPVTKAPRRKDLHTVTLNELARVTNLDRALYEAAKEAYEKVKNEYSEGLEEEVARFRELQQDVLAVLNEGVGRGGTVSPSRAWYMPESDYYFYSADKTKWYTEEYYPAPLPF